MNARKNISNIKATEGQVESIFDDVILFMSLHHPKNLYNIHVSIEPLGVTSETFDRTKYLTVNELKSEFSDKYGEKPVDNTPLFTFFIKNTKNPVEQDIQPCGEAVDPTAESGCGCGFFESKEQCDCVSETPQDKIPEKTPYRTRDSYSKEEISKMSAYDRATTFPLTADERKKLTETPPLNSNPLNKDLNYSFVFPSEIVENEKLFNYYRTTLTTLMSNLDFYKDAANRVELLYWLDRHDILLVLNRD